MAVIDPKTEFAPFVFVAPPAPTVTVIDDPGVIVYPVEVKSPPAPPPPELEAPPVLVPAPPPPATTKYSTVEVGSDVRGLIVPVRRPPNKD
jgi:hypothetical protein